MSGNKVFTKATDIKCDQPLCPGCRQFELRQTVSAAGHFLQEDIPKTDTGLWQTLDDAFGLTTLPVVKRIAAESDYPSFTYPELWVEWMPDSLKKGAEQFGASVSEEVPEVVTIKWNLPAPCGLLLSGGSIKYLLSLHDPPPWPELKEATRNGQSLNGTELLDAAMNRARHKHTSYEDFLRWHKERGPLEERAVNAIRRAHNEMVVEAYPHLRPYV